MGKVRPFVEDDIPIVADLYARVFPDSNPLPPQDLVSYFGEIFFHNPWYEKDLSSLIYQQSDGRIVGFLGVVPRRMLLNSRPIQVAICFHFMVEPGSRSTLAGVELLRRLFMGPQDLTMTDGAGDEGRRIWEALGGSTALLYSLYWTRPLRPSRYAMSLLGKRRLWPLWGHLAMPFCSIADALATRALQSHLRLTPQPPEEELSCETLLTGLREFLPTESLRPQYDQQSLEWLLRRAGQRKHEGTFRKVIVRNTTQEIVGWYLYYSNPGGISSVLQVAGKKNSIKQVLDHLFYQSWWHGALAVCGRLDPRFVQEFSDRYCLFDRRGPWTLVHSNNPELLTLILRGDAFLTRLEGEWCLRLEGG